MFQKRPFRLAIRRGLCVFLGVLRALLAMRFPHRIALNLALIRAWTTRFPRRALQKAVLGFNTGQVLGYDVTRWDYGGMQPPQRYTIRKCPV